MAFDESTKVRYWPVPSIKEIEAKADQYRALINEESGVIESSRSKNKRDSRENSDIEEAHSGRASVNRSEVAFGRSQHSVRSRPQDQ
jgi:hypothetical protein